MTGATNEYQRHSHFYRSRFGWLVRGHGAAALAAKDLAIKTNTGIVVAIDGKNVELAAADLIKLREQEDRQSHR